jgi:two-component system, chemotaxis family, sensor kinase CheA
LKEFVSAYVVEAEEHLETASTQLLAVENALRAGGSNLKGVREAFRAIHTIKGLSAMVGVEPIVTIAHRLEAILRGHDRRAEKLPLDAIDTLLSGLRSIKDAVSAFGEDRPVPAPHAELLRALDALDSGHVSTPAEPASLELDAQLAKKLGPLELEQLHAGLSEGRSALRIDFAPSIEKSARGVNINYVREQAQRLGELVKVFPVSTASPGAPSGALAFVLILLSSAETAAVAEALGVEASAIEVLASPSAPALPILAEDDELQPAPTAAASDEARGRQRGVVRVDVARLDETVEGLSALIVTRFRLTRAVKALRDQGVDTRSLDEIVADNARQLRHLRSAILRVRMVPVAELLERTPLLVRNLRRTMNRQVRLELESGGAELDKAVAERLFPALVHLIRNAVDHAIETPEERVRRGKPEEGLIRIECSSTSNRWLEMRISDDGRGIDAAAVAKRARAPVPSNGAGLLALICRSGLSTREVATTVSGRGMGMEIVQRIVTEQLGGELSLSTELGRGTSFLLRVPLSISVIDAFSFLCAGQRFVTPVGTVEEIVEVDQRAVIEAPSSSGSAVRLVRHRGRVVPLLSLSRVFALEAGSPEGMALIVRRGGDAVAFAIDRMLGQQEVVVRPLNDVLVRVPGVSGATDLGDGQPTLVLDLFSLGARAADARQIGQS